MSFSIDSPCKRLEAVQMTRSEAGASAAWSKPQSPAFPSATVQRCKGRVLSSRSQPCFYSLD